MRRHRTVGGTHRDATVAAGAVKAGVLGVLATATIAAPLAAAAAGIDDTAAQQGEAIAQAAPAAVQAQPAAATAPVAIPAADAATEARGEGAEASRDADRTSPVETADAAAAPDALEVEAPEPEPVVAEEASASTGAASGEGYIKPADGPITSGYGGRMHPVLGYFKGHDGVDFGAACGTPAKAAKAGTVVAVEYNSASGNRVKIDHGDGIVTGYYHLQGFNTSVGAEVEQGDTVGYVGSTGRSTGCHLHFSKMDEAGNYSDPMSILP